MCCKRGNPQTKRLLEEPWRAWKNNTKLYFQCERMDWIYLAQDTDQWRDIMNKSMYTRVQYCAITRLSRKALLYRVSLQAIMREV